jgi:hypothetical protein
MLHGSETSLGGLAEMPRSKKHAKAQAEISTQELARFLRQLASLYHNKRTGNPAMGVALMTLADQLSEKVPPDAEQAQFIRGRFWDLDLKSLDLEVVKDLIEDRSMTKGYLVNVGVERFSIPKSKLSKLNIDGIISEIRNAALHEESLFRGCAKP